MLSVAQRDLLDYLDGCTYATPRTILRVTGHRMNTVNALIRRGLAEFRLSPVGLERVYITDEGRATVNSEEES